MSYKNYKNTAQSMQRRKHFRLVYPPGYEPRLFIEGRQYYVIDLSEAGIRFDNPFLNRMPEDLVVAVIRLHHDKENIKIVGRVQRIQNSEIALVLILGIPYSKILSEQLFLQNKRSLKAN